MVCFIVANIIKKNTFQINPFFCFFFFKNLERKLFFVSRGNVTLVCMRYVIIANNRTCHYMTALKTLSLKKTQSFTIWKLFGKKMRVFNSCLTNVLLISS